MNIKDLTTPCFLVDLDILERNINKFQSIADNNKTQLWPMLKTHKSTEITGMQIEAGATGVLCGTLDEAETVVDKLGVERVMLAYPVLGEANIKRIIELNKKAEVFIALDAIEAAKEISALLGDTTINYLIIFDSGLGRFGAAPEMVAPLVRELSALSNLHFAGICTHTGQVYGVSGSSEVADITATEIHTTERVVKSLAEEGFTPQIVATGTTPTFFEAVKSDIINVSRPGNYVFFDAIQIALGKAQIEDCSLTVMATVVSHPREDLFILDCGSKCLGLDKGAHGTSLTAGYGIIKGYPELIMAGLSEEVAKVQVCGETNLKVGDRVEIIPNHSCSAANMTDYLIGYRGKQTERIIEVDIRGNSIRPDII